MLVLTAHAVFPGFRVQKTVLSSVKLLQNNDLAESVVRAERSAEAQPPTATFSLQALL